MSHQQSLVTPDHEVYVRGVDALPMNAKTEEMSKQRMGEIALMLVTHQLAKNLPTMEVLKREVPNKAKEYGLTGAEACAFLNQILPTAVALRLGCESVTLDWGL